MLCLFVLGVSFIMHVRGVDFPWVWKILIMRRIVKKEQREKGKKIKKEKKYAVLLKIAF